MEDLIKFFTLPWTEKRFLFEAVGFLFLAKGMLLILPFKSCLRWIPPVQSEKTPDEVVLIKIKFAIARANRLAFWKNECLVKSMAARWMLQRRRIPSKLSFGMMLNEQKKPMAHAWIEVRGIEIVGKEKGFIELLAL